MRVLITGGEGFIGSWLARKFLSVGTPLALLDAHRDWRRISSEDRDFQLRFRQMSCSSEAIRLNHELGVGDLKTRDAISQFQPTHVVHLAANPLADVVERSPCEGRRDILDGTRELLEILSDLKSLRRVVFASSSMVYGNFEAESVTEDHPLAPTNKYGLYKMQAEELVRRFAQLQNKEFCIVRPIAVYGPGDVNNRVVQKWLGQALRGEAISVRGSDDRLDFTYVEDVAEGFWLATTRPEAAGRVFNISRGQSRSLGDLATALLRIFPTLQVEEHARDASLPRRGTLSIENARTVLGFAPQYSLEEGLNAYLNMFQRRDISRAEQVMG